MKTFGIRLTVLALAIVSLCGVAWGADGTAVRDGHVYRIVNTGSGNAIKSNGTGNISASAVSDTEQKQLWIAEEKGEGFYMRSLVDGNYITSPRARSQAWQTQYTIDPDDAKMLLKFVPDGDGYFIHTVADYGSDSNEGLYGYAAENSFRIILGSPSGAANVRWNFSEVTDITPAEIAAMKSSWRQCVSEIISGGVYRIINYYYGHAMTPAADNSLIGSAVDPSADNQVWIVEQNPQGEGYFLRNYDTGVVAHSSRARTEPWSVTDGYEPSQDESALYFVKKQTGYGISTVSTRGLAAESADYTFASEYGGRMVVSNAVTLNGSLWLFAPADDITPEDVAAKMQTWECTKTGNAQKALRALFADDACTELNPEYALRTPEVLAADPNVLALPEALRPMVIKVLTGDWAETDTRYGNEWDTQHARKLRVQMVEPYSECDAAAGLIAIQAYTNLNNPTGIITNDGDVLYVMVDREPADGSRLYITGRTGEGTPLATLNNPTDGYRLRKGLNVVPCTGDLADMIIYYSVVTADGDRTRLRKVTDYEDIKIHIEGGSLNGYFNSEGDALYTPDTNEDWLYYRERAKYPMFTLLSRYATLYIHFDDITDGNGARVECLKSLCSPEAYAEGRYDLVTTMKEWDKMYVAETLLMGLLPPEVIEAEKAAGRDYYDTLAGDPVARDDYYKYFNNRMMGISMRECGFMNATRYRTAYNPSTISSIIREFPTGDIWGPAHEFGHQNQQPMKIAGTTEQSNNVFSNVVLIYRGKQASRADFPSEQRRRFNEGQNFHQHDTWGTTRMWLQLWLYYHAVGHDKRFYPRLYELLRNDPLRHTEASGHSGVINPVLAKDDLLHFAKMVCVAAGEDLTDFFEAWGFFVEQDGYFIDDYASYTSYLSAEDIAEWKADIARMAAENGWKKNTAILFIDDRVGSPLLSYGQFDKTKCGTMGGLADFREGAPVVGDYTYSVTGTTVTVSGGQGGVGFLVYDTDGKLIGFANEPVFKVNMATADKLRRGEATFKVVDHSNRETVIAAGENPSLDRLVDLISKTREAAGTLAGVTEQVVPVELTSADMYSNAPHTAAGSDLFRSWSVLFDNNTSTYFHSSYTGSDSEDGEDHYIRITLPDEESADYVLGYITRQNTASTWVPSEADIECSTDGKTWQRLTSLAEELPVGSAQRFDSDPLSVPSGMRYLRFIVRKNRRAAQYASSDAKGGHYYFVLSELWLNLYDVTCTPHTYIYPKADEGMIREALRAAQSADQAFYRDDYGPAQYEAAYEALYPHYQRLQEMLDSRTGIESIPVDDADSLRDAVIYNLNGYRVDRVTTPGIYIINGRKVLVK